MNLLTRFILVALGILLLAALVSSDLIKGAKEELSPNHLSSSAS